MTDELKLPKAKLPSAFRVWLQQKWFEHKDELMNWERREPEYDDKYYFRKHKWMLRRMFQEEQIEKFMKENEREIKKQIKRGFKKGNL